MASVSISKWDVAEALGLECVSPYIGRDDGLDYVHDFEFNGAAFSIKEGYWGVRDQEGAKEQAAQQVLNVLGKIIAERMVADATVG